MLVQDERHKFIQNLKLTPLLGDKSWHFAHVCNELLSTCQRTVAFLLFWINIWAFFLGCLGLEEKSPKFSSEKQNRQKTLR